LDEEFRCKIKTKYFGRYDFRDEREMGDKITRREYIG